MLSKVTLSEHFISYTLLLLRWTSWTVDIRWDWFNAFMYFCQILTLTCECCSNNHYSSDQTAFLQSVVQFRWASMNCSFSFLFLADRRCALLFLRPVCFRFLICCAFRDARLHDLVETSGYLSYCSLPFSLKHSPLTSDINRHFLQRTLAQ